MTPPAAQGRDGDGEDDGDDAGRANELFEAHVSFADHLARRYSHGIGVDEDLQQVARLGLLLAARRFDPEQGRFMRFASLTIVGELKKHLRSHGWSVHVARSLQEDSITVATSTERLTQSSGRDPRVSEISKDTGLSPERVADAIRVRQARFRAPLDHSESVVESDNDLDRTVLLNLALDSLDPEERHLIALRFDSGLTQREIGERLGVSQPEAYRRIGAALRRLRQQLDTHEGGSA